MKPHLLSFLVLLSIMFITCECYADFYRYYDENGRVTITNELKSIPLRFRSGVQTITEKDLENRTSAAEKRIGNYENKVRKPGSEGLGVAPTQNYVAPTAVSNSVSQNESEKPPTDSSRQSWFARQLPMLKIIAIAVAALAGLTVTGKFVSSLAPRPLAIVIKIALFAAVTVFLFKGYAAKVSDAFALIKKSGDTVQKTIDNRSERIQKQSE